MPRFDEANTLRLATAMRELHARLRVANMSDAESIELTSHLPAPDFFQRGEISNWMTDAGPLDVLHDMPDRDGHRLGYDQLVERADAHRYTPNITVVVAGLADIVASKEYANRAKDREALPELYQMLGRNDNGPGPAAGPGEPSPRPDRADGGHTPPQSPRPLGR